jgi:hypothetical protein
MHKPPEYRPTAVNTDNGPDAARTEVAKATAVDVVPPDIDERPRQRIAIVFIPGMGENWVEQSVAGIAARLAQALDGEAPKGRRFSVEFDVREESFATNLRTAACTISRDDGSGEVPYVDVYKLDAVRTLRARFEDWSFLAKALFPLAFVFLYLRGVLTAFRKRAGKTRRERYQLLFAILVLALLTFYVFLLAFAILKTAFPHLIDEIPIRATQGAVVALTALGLWKSNYVSAAAQGAVGYICVIAYLGFGERRDQLVGQFAALIDYIREKKDVQYHRIDVISYSFGTIVALDALFPTGTRDRRFSEVKALVTVGCPFDFIRTYWPTYFEGRMATADVPQNWLNVYSPIDILASNFRADGETGPAEVGIPTAGDTEVHIRKPTNINYGGSRSVTDVSPLEFMTFMGLRSHSLYWARTHESELTVFSPIVKEVYADEPVLH